jgi:hypothetical protein
VNVRDNLYNDKATESVVYDLLEQKFHRDAKDKNQFKGAFGAGFDFPI